MSLIPFLHDTPLGTSMLHVAFSLSDAKHEQARDMLHQLYLDATGSKKGQSKLPYFSATIGRGPDEQAAGAPGVLGKNDTYFSSRFPPGRRAS